MENIYAELADAHSEAEANSAELVRAKEFTDNIIRSMVNALVVTDASGTITVANEAASSLLQYHENELVGSSLDHLFDNGESPVLCVGSPLWKELLDKGVVKERELLCRCKDGTRVPVSFSGSVLTDMKGDALGVVCIVRDLRETKRLLAEAASAAEAERTKSAELEAAYHELQNLQAHLVQSEKMRSLGRMAAGVAHEVNNPLGGIVIYSHLVLEDTAADDPRRENLEKIVKEATRCGGIVKGLLGFARPQVEADQLMNPGRALTDTLSVLKGQAIFHNIDIDCEIDPELPSIPGDASQIQQAFMNIMLNAADAMEGKGTLTMSAKVEKATGSIVVSFADTGPGIKPEHIERLYEPFFTTKPPGKGVGLGLAITYGIIEQHGGTIEVRSRPGEGTKFEVRLPCEKPK
jgi:PAS domain S-box-containing protein